MFSTHAVARLAQNAINVQASDRVALPRFALAKKRTTLVCQSTGGVSEKGHHSTHGGLAAVMAWKTQQCIEMRGVQLAHCSCEGHAVLTSCLFY